MEEMKVRKGGIWHLSIVIVLTWIISMNSITCAQHQNEPRIVDLLNEETMESVNNTVISESFTLLVRIEYDDDSDMDGILDAYELPQHIHDFDNDAGTPDDPTNPVFPDTGEDGFDHDSDNDGIEDVPWGNDTVLIQPLTNVSRMPIVEYLTLYIDERNCTMPMTFDISNITIDLDISELSEGVHVIYVHHSQDNGTSTFATTYTFYFEVEKEVEETFPAWVVYLILMLFIICISIVIFVAYRIRKEKNSNL